MNVFVSYSRRDKDFALRLVQALRDWGHDPWFDLEKIPKGANWPDEIDKGLDAADVVVGVLSENAMESGPVKSEWEYALVNNKPLIPIRLSATKVSFRFVRLNYIDCVNDEQLGFQSLQKALQSPKTSVVENNPVSVVTSQSAKFQPIESVKQRVNNRTAMLNKVHDFWIKGVFEPAEFGDAWLELPAIPYPKAVDPETKRELHSPDFDAFSLGLDAKIVNVFHQMGRELLILGAPGSGKTMSLLELARDLIVQAQMDDMQPIPVVFNLASWAEKHPKNLVDWLIDRLFLDYGVSRKLGISWIENGNLVYLFDGLDEVEEIYRDACVVAINIFWRKYDQVDNGIAVCSRIADYEKLATILKLENAITLGKLTPAQADEYLIKLGPSWADLRAAIPSDNVLQVFAESPLLLNIMAVAYQKTPQGQIIGLNEASQKHQLFNRYVARCLRVDKAPKKYPNAKTQYYLSWLAKKMVQHQQIVFHIEGLQPNWLDPDNQRRAYSTIWRFVVLVVVVGGTLVGSLAFGSLGELTGGLIGGIGGGVISIVVSGLIDSLIGSVLGALIGAVVYAVVDGAIRELPLIMPFQELVFILLKLIIVALAGGGGGIVGKLVVTLVSRQRRGRINIAENLNWSWKKAWEGLFKGLAMGLIGGLIFVICAYFFYGLWVLRHYGLGGMLVSVLIGMLLGALVVGLNTTSVGQNANPNEGIWRSVRNSLLGGLLGGSVGFLIGWLMFFLFGNLVNGLGSIFFGLSIGTLFGLLQYGGESALQHLILRNTLYRYGVAPFNYAELLDYCVSRQLMRRVGGGFIFRHRMLMEYFAEKND